MVFSSGAEALSDFEVMFSNCYLYNKPTDDVTLMCQAVESAFKDLVKKMNSDPTLRSELEVLGAIHENEASLKILEISIIFWFPRLTVCFRPNHRTHPSRRKSLRGRERSSVHQRRRRSPRKRTTRPRTLRKQSLLGWARVARAATLGKTSRPPSMKDTGFW